ncbi:hypothetical protein F2P81_020734 [Scophthalmus maximus]|uniref:Major facilitator superfamily (MFS) profile domain-containing protein n=1 Tax=Scophthalmus maximus TaxID=52904 RepID=A0A6A4RZG4_SCOMX|nr:hypothetical protein F2P81_020734 [Scophthalmus maximus]
MQYSQFSIQPLHNLIRYRALTFILTFLLYTSFHLSRKPISIVKTKATTNSCWEPWTTPSSVPMLLECTSGEMKRTVFTATLLMWSNAGCLLSDLWHRGIIGERLPIRLYLTVGMLTSGLFTCLFGLGHVYNIHSLGFYVFVQVANGLVQTTGWPSVVTCIGNWFGKGRRGLIMGLWNSHTSVGNILGSLIAGYWVSSNWGLSFIVPGIIIAAMGVLCFFFLIEHPNDLKSMYAKNSSPGKSSYDTELLLPRDRVCVPVQPVVVVKSESEPSAISFMGALRIPGVIEFSLCLLFAKLVSYTFLFWLPLYITKAGELYGFSMISEFGLGPTIGMLLVCGGLVNGPYALITTAVSADLGTHKSLKGNARALSTVTAIIDGTGSQALGTLEEVSFLLLRFRIHSALLRGCKPVSDVVPECLQNLLLIRLPPGLPE